MSYIIFCDVKFDEIILTNISKSTYICKPRKEKLFSKHTAQMQDNSNHAYGDNPNINNLSGFRVEGHFANI